jgi:hypothetical protein
MFDIERLERLTKLIESVNDEHVYNLLVGVLEAELYEYLDKYLLRHEVVTLCD